MGGINQRISTGGLSLGGLNKPSILTTAVVWSAALKSAVGHSTHQHWLRKAHLYKGGALKSLMLLWKVLAQECANELCTSATRDYKIVTCRCEHEGLSFLTITLPKFGKDFQKSLDRGWVDRDLFQGFSWRAGLPRFLGGFLDRVFDRASGELLNEPDIDAIRSIRQLTLMFGKIQLPCSDARERAAMSDYVECEKEVRIADTNRSPQLLEDFGRMSALLFRDVLTVVDREAYYGEMIPKHGPGATADRLRANAKYRLSSWTDRLESIFPAGEFLLPNWSFVDQYFGIDHLEPGAEKPVRVISVPKTLETPRIIAAEPTAMQYAQQAVLRSLRKALQRNDTLWSLLGFLDQTPNQRMAEEGSRYRNLATLDLSEASDRVSNQLVREMLLHHPWLYRAVDASRSRKADVPGHGEIRLAKFASMGSALTFPMEAMVFLTIIFLGIERELNSPLTRRMVKPYVGKVRVFGDDIIVPKDYVHSVVDMLETFGFRVNAGKSFWTGKFRESCGRDYYAGSDVSVVRVRRKFPTQRQHTTEVISIVSLRNQLYQAGYWQTVRWLDDYIRGVLKHFPTVLPSSPVLGRHSLLAGEQFVRMPDRWCYSLHKPLVKGYIADPKIPVSKLEGSGALLKWFLHKENQDDDCYPDSTDWMIRKSWNTRHLAISEVEDDHLTRAGRAYAVKLKLGWGSQS